MKPKYRAWDKTTNKMRGCYGFNELEREVYVCSVADDEFNGQLKTVHALKRSFDEVILMQSTGLEDKNGVGIFEGDILTTEQYPYQVEGEYNYHGVVEWDKESAGYIVVKYVVNTLISGISNGVADRFEGMDGFEVIGNIYENPELLEVTNEN